jgi:hypothetical protein
LFEEELERTFVVHKLRGISDVNFVRQHSPSHPLPPYLSQRGACVLGLPAVLLVELQEGEGGAESMEGVEPLGTQHDPWPMQVETAEEGPDLDTQQEDGESRGGDEEQEERREALRATLTHVLHGLNDQLYVELLEMIRLR